MVASKHKIRHLKKTAFRALIVYADFRQQKANDSQKAALLREIQIKTKVVRGLSRYSQWKKMAVQRRHILGQVISTIDNQNLLQAAFDSFLCHLAQNARKIANI